MRPKGTRHIQRSGILRLNSRHHVPSAKSPSAHATSRAPWNAGACCRADTASAATASSTILASPARSEHCVPFVGEPRTTAVVTPSCPSCSALPPKSTRPSPQQHTRPGTARDPRSFHSPCPATTARTPMRQRTRPPDSPCGRFRSVRSAGWRDWRPSADEAAARGEHRAIKRRWRGRGWTLSLDIGILSGRDGGGSKLLAGHRTRGWHCRFESRTRDKHGIPKCNAGSTVCLLIWSLCGYHQGIGLGIWQDTEWGCLVPMEGGGAFPQALPRSPYHQWVSVD
ncbi:hypothetical protein BT67DRAFT_15969 [Trichocladium antarcticum]|uniref:Uncharacterized protein n=1 Tax=Trichocladium antarcticum TaxID=1450529 RepID=A0AAN6ZIF5_9PEZI|nr:hypothetical protein BT67DRAFT_15969 [Trichocladium antarcticum]